MHAEVPAILSQDVYSKYPPPVINKQRKYIPTHHAYNSNNLVIFYGIALYYVVVNSHISVLEPNQIPYSGKLSKEKTFVNSVVL